MVIALSSMMALKAVKLTVFDVYNEDEEEKNSNWWLSARLW